MVNQSDFVPTKEPPKDPMCAYYEERRRDLEKIRSDSMDSFDKAILQVSTGALVITITFIDKVGKPYDAFTNIILILFWALFLSVIIVNILSFLFAKKNMDFRIVDLDNRYKTCPENWTKIEPAKTAYRGYVDFCNNLSLYLFLAGAVLFFIYAYMVQTRNFEDTARKEGSSMVGKIKEIKKLEELKPGEPGIAKKAQTEAPERIIITSEPKGGDMHHEQKPIKEGRTEPTEKIIQDTGKRGQTESPERVIKPPKEAGRDAEKKK